MTQNFDQCFTEMLWSKSAIIQSLTFVQILVNKECIHKITQPDFISFIEA